MLFSIFLGILNFVLSQQYSCFYVKAKIKIEIPIAKGVPTSRIVTFSLILTNLLRFEMNFVSPQFIEIIKKK
jgi:hypothetical protein